MLKFSTDQSMIFGLIDGASEGPKIILWSIKDLSIPLDRARRVVLGTYIGTLGTRGVTLFLLFFIIKNKDKENLYIYKIKIKKIFILKNKDKENLYIYKIKIKKIFILKIKDKIKK